MNENKKKTTKIELAAFFSTILYCMTLSWRASHFYTVFRLFGRIITPICALISSYLVKYTLDLLSGSLHVNNKTYVLITLLVGTLIIALVTSGIQKGLQYCQTIHSEIISNQITMQVITKSLKADLEFFDNPKYHDKLSAVSRDSLSIVNILWNVLECISSFIAFICAFVILSGSNFYYGLAVFLAAIPFSIAGAQFTKSLYKLSLNQIKSERKKSYIQAISTSRQYSQEIRLFRAEDYLRDRYNQLWQSLFDDRRKTLRKRSILIGILEYLPEIVLVGIALDVSFRVLANNATIGDYTLYAGLAKQLYGSVLMFSSSAIQIYDDKLRIDNIKTLDIFMNKINTGSKKLEKVRTIEFCCVSFSYPESNRKAIDNISFKVEDGEKVALVGINGSGKSTLIKLLLRFYDVDSGVIKINNIDIREFDLYSLRSNFSVYFQDMPNYSFTIRENLEIADLGRMDGDEALLEAIKESCSDDIFHDFPEKLETYISRMFEDSGIELSGGQHQKIALARAFYRRHTALILDEPSSSLDSEAEYKVFESLRRLSYGKTTLFTSHRLSNVGLANRIIVLENGRIIEQGTLAELLDNPNRFAMLFKYQQDKYTEVAI
ncbi:MAG: ABC transporter ATP-binding protein [Crenarchaeota archaeon]|nr:ABC transporter ATP-binding protein [Thermoproteota archaeon]